jgi:hypothetical protein
MKIIHLAPFGCNRMTWTSIGPRPIPRGTSIVHNLGSRDANESMGWWVCAFLLDSGRPLLTDQTVSHLEYGMAGYHRVCHTCLWGWHLWPFIGPCPSLGHLKPDSVPEPKHLGLTLTSSSCMRNEDSSNPSAGNILRKHWGILTEDTRGRGGRVSILSTRGLLFP